MQIKTNFQMKGWAPGLALKKRPKFNAEMDYIPAPTSTSKMQDKFNTFIWIRMSTLGQT